jgi:hypothetical protein
MARGALRGEHGSRGQRPAAPSAGSGALARTISGGRPVHDVVRCCTSTPVATPTRSLPTRRLLPTVGDSGAVDVLSTRLARLDPATPPLWGRMHAVAMLRHLNDAFETMDGVRPLPDAASRSGDARRAAMTRFVALYLPIPWPQGLRTPPTLDQEEGGTPPGAFTDECVTLLEHLARYARGVMPVGRAHPSLGPLSAWEWQRWAYLHVDHHFRQFGLGRSSRG